MIENQGNLCKNCRYRFRRVFIPLHPEEYEDAEGNSVLVGEDSIIISNQCLLTNMDIDKEATVECSHFESIDKNKKENFPLLKHLR
jgi:hypothetical protein